MYRLTMHNVTCCMTLKPQGKICLADSVVYKASSHEIL